MKTKHPSARAADRAGEPSPGITAPEAFRLEAEAVSGGPVERVRTGCSNRPHSIRAPGQLGETFPARNGLLKHQHRDHGPGSNAGFETHPWQAEFTLGNGGQPVEALLIDRTLRDMPPKGN
jgi:hypothetical protein